MLRRTYNIGTSSAPLRRLLLPCSSQLHALGPKPFRRLYSSTFHKGAVSRVNPELDQKLSKMETRWHEGLKRLERAKYLLLRNPHASRGRSEVDVVKKKMDNVHNEFQQMLQRSATVSVSQTEHVLDAYCQLFKPTAWHYNVLMDSLKRHQPTQCCDLIARMDREGIEPDVTTFNIMLEAMLSNKSSVGNLQSVLETMKSRSIECDADTHSVMLVAFANVGNVDEVEKGLSEMMEREEVPNVMALTAMLSMYGKRNMFDVAEGIRSVLMNGEHALLARHYSEVMRYLLRVKDLKAFQDVWLEMEKKSFRPADDVFASYLKALFKATVNDKHTDDAMSSAERKNAFGLLIRRAKAASVRLNLLPAMSIFIELVADQNSEVLADLMQALSMATPETRDRAYEELVNYFATSGNVDNIINVLDLFPVSQLSPQTVGNLLLCGGVTKFSAATQKLLHYLIEKNVPVYKETLFKMMYAFSNRLDIEGCKVVVEAMKKLGIEPTQHVMNAFISACINTNQPADMIFKVFNDAVRRKFRIYVPNAQTLIVLASSRNDVKACSTLFEFLKFEDRVPTELEYQSYIMTLAKARDADRAMSVLAEMKDAKQSPSRDLVGSVIDRLTLSNKLNEAIYVLEQFSGFRGIPAAPASKLVQTLCDRDDIENAEHVCMLMESAGVFPHTIALNSMLRAYGRAGCCERARTVFAIMKVGMVICGVGAGYCWMGYGDRGIGGGDGVGSAMVMEGGVADDGDNGAFVLAMGMVFGGGKY